MAKQPDLAGMLRGMYSEVIKEAAALCNAPYITAEQFRRINSAYAAVMGEARAVDQRLHDRLYDESIELMTRLKVNARAHAISEFTLWATMFSDLATGTIKGVAPAPLHEVAPRVIEARSAGKAQDIDAIVARYQINPNFTDRD